MRLPPDSYIAVEKLTNYLLVPQNRGDKSAWLAKAGYRLENYELLRRDLQNQILPLEAVCWKQMNMGRFMKYMEACVGPTASRCVFEQSG